MRITYLSFDSLAEGVGASQVLAYVEKLSERGVQVSLHTFEKIPPTKGLQERLHDAGVIWHTHKFGRFGAAGGISRVLRAAMAIRGANLVHARSDLAAAATMLAGVKNWLWDFRSFYVDQKIELGELRRGSIQEKVLRVVAKQAAKRSTAIVTLTQTSIPLLVQQYGDEIAEKAYVITTCVDTETFMQTEMPASDPLRLLLSGTINSYYDVPLMIQLVQHAAKQTALELHVVTPSSTKWDEELDQIATTRRAAAPWEIDAIVAGSHAGLAVCREDAGISLRGSMPTKIGEFLASGRPVVVNRSLGDIASLIELRGCGVVLDDPTPEGLDIATTSLLELVRDPETATRCRHLALEYFDLSNAVRELKRIYSAMHNGAGRETEFVTADGGGDKILPRAPVRKRKSPVERVGIDPRSPWWSEHRARYRFAAPYCTGKVVLDVASGSGLGADILTDAGAAGVIAIDNSQPAVASASKLGLDGLNVIQADACRLPLALASVDVVVSFETIEHLADSEAFVVECRRVLRREGIAVFSTPDARYTRPIEGRPQNPHHVKEFTPAEFGVLLGRHFGSVELKVQRTALSWGPSPYWDKKEWLPETRRARTGLLIWRLGNRLPSEIKDNLSRLKVGRPFYPTDQDFDFLDVDKYRGHVLVALCRP